VTWPEVGTAVGAQFLYDSCGHCDYCVRGEQILCPSKRITGVVTDGGYAEYAVLVATLTPSPGVRRPATSFSAASRAWSPSIRAGVAP
ncbi:alcohol dehydrogenase catalytic domain-containing protein, partial [Streptomyces sp. NPDC046870]|uniref:alcohol dehydrogenase catalytic domain-containing protein n=1 Tax=Streptomyces sp. NPDC046870 TaxID=3155135 RepID=UPI0034518EC2